VLGIKNLIMKTVLIITIAVAIIVGSMAFIKKSTPADLSQVPSDFYELTFKDIDGVTVKMSDFKGKYVMCVNVASKCGYTKQYKPLQELYELYGEQLVVIGFPCNQFMNQEPGTESEIAEFCEKNYGVKFLMTEKIDVKGSEIHPVYAWLTNKSLNGVSDATVSWNFNKFLISPNGEWLGHFKSAVDPLSQEITGLLK
jgi:glutathione peroxidase